MPMLLTPYNYKLLFMGALLVVLGFGGMYIEGQQYGIYSLFIGPVLIMAGFVVVAVSVFKTDPAVLEKEKEAQAAPESESATTDTTSTA